MKAILTAQQAAFYTQHGYIEFEIPHPSLIHTEGRDLWRSQLPLKNFLLRKIGPIALTLSGKAQLRLGSDQWLAKEALPKKRGKLKDLFSLQNLSIGIIFADAPLPSSHRSSLGILPLPSSAQHVLFFRPELLLDWPGVASDLYVAFFTLERAVYIYNPLDPFTHALKAFGYQFGDCLKTESHPLLRR